MSVKYHINPNSGNANICRAVQGNCPFGSPSEHFDTKVEARAHYEQVMDNATAGLRSIQKEIGAKRNTREAFENVVDSLNRYTPQNLNKADRKFLLDLRAGKNLSDAKIDSFLARNQQETVANGYNDATNAAHAAKVFAYIGQVRSERGTPSTLDTLDTFDPSVQTTFSNKDARKNATIAGKAVRREAAHADWMHELADNDFAVANHVKNGGHSSFTVEELEASGQDRRRQAFESEARVQAQLREIQYLHDNDDAFASSARAEVSQVLANGWFRPRSYNANKSWIGLTHPVK